MKKVESTIVEFINDYAKFKNVRKRTWQQNLKSIIVYGLCSPEDDEFLVFALGWFVCKAKFARLPYPIEEAEQKVKSLKNLLYLACDMYL